MKISQSATGMTIEQVAERCKELADALESMEVPGDPNAPDGIMVSAETPMNIASHLRAAVQAIAAAEARGEERMREKAAKCAADVILSARTGDIDTDLRSIGYILQGDIRALPIGEE